MATQELITSRNPTTEDVLATFTPATAEQIEQGLSAASRAFRSWRGAQFPERAALIRSAKIRGQSWGSTGGLLDSLV